jgi:hypothetical protein
MRFTSVRGAASLAVFVAGVALTAVACGDAPASALPTSRPTPLVTPDPHLADPATADQVWRGLGAAGLRMTANNATAGGPDSALVKSINATYLGWPLNLSEFRSSAALAETLAWEAGEAPGQGEAPIAIAGVNILVTWGPMTGEQPATPDPRQVEALDALVSALDRLLSPLSVRTNTPIDVPGVVLGPTPPASPDGTTGEGGATAAP